MYSRLYRNVLQRYGDVENASAFSLSYFDSGLFGIASSILRRGMTLDMMLNILVTELLEIAFNIDEGRV